MKLLAEGLRAIVSLLFIAGMISAVPLAFGALKTDGGLLLSIGILIAAFAVLAVLLGTIALLFRMHDRLEEIAELLRDRRAPVAKELQRREPEFGERQSGGGTAKSS